MSNRILSEVKIRYACFISLIFYFLFIAILFIDIEPWIGKPWTSDLIILYVILINYLILKVTYMIDKNNIC